MRFFTREWYELMQRTGCAGEFVKLPDGHYTDADIRKLSDRKLKKEIERDRKSYNAPPKCLIDPESITEENFVPENWMFIDPETGKTRVPESAEEVKIQLREDVNKAMERFENRPPFDPAETVEIFEECYKNNRRACVRKYPEWLTGSVDHRLIALGMLPETAYKRYCAETKENGRQWKAINKKAERVLEKQEVPENIKKAFQLHDASLLSLKKQGKNLVMLVRKDGMWPDDETPYRRLTFTAADVIEKDAGLVGHKYDNDGFTATRVTFLYHEIYRVGDSYEIHMMFWGRGREPMPYLTLRCGDVIYEDGIKL